MLVSKQLIVSIKRHSNNEPQTSVLEEWHCQSLHLEVILNIFNDTVFIQHF